MSPSEYCANCCNSFAFLFAICEYRELQICLVLPFINIEHRISVWPCRNGPWIAVHPLLLFLWEGKPLWYLVWVYSYLVVAVWGPMVIFHYNIVTVCMGFCELFWIFFLRDFGFFPMILSIDP